MREVLCTSNSVDLSIGLDSGPRVDKIRRYVVGHNCRDWDFMNCITAARAEYQACFVVSLETIQVAVNHAIAND